MDTTEEELFPQEDIALTALERTMNATTIADSDGSPEGNASYQSFDESVIVRNKKYRNRVIMSDDDYDEPKEVPPKVLSDVIILDSVDVASPVAKRRNLTPDNEVVVLAETKSTRPPVVQLANSSDDDESKEPDIVFESDDDYGQHDSVSFIISDGVTTVSVNENDSEVSFREKRREKDSQTSTVPAPVMFRILIK